MVETVLRLRGWQYLDADLYRTLFRIHQRYLLLQVSADSFRHIKYAINFLVDKLTIFTRKSFVTRLHWYHAFAFYRLLSYCISYFHILNEFTF